MVVVLFKENHRTIVHCVISKWFLFCGAGYSGTAAFEPDQGKVCDSLGALLLLSLLHRLQTWSKHCTLPVQTVLVLFCQSFARKNLSAFFSPNTEPRDLLNG